MYHDILPLNRCRPGKQRQNWSPAYLKPAPKVLLLRNPIDKLLLEASSFSGLKNYTNGHINLKIKINFNYFQTLFSSSLAAHYFIKIELVR